MIESADAGGLMTSLNGKIATGEKWLEKCDCHLSRVQGIGKLKRKIGAELSFLKSLRVKDCDDELKVDHIHSSNLFHLQAIVHAACTTTDVIAVLQTFNFRRDTSDAGSGNKIVVDLVCDGGDAWVKVVARNQKSLNQISLGQGHFGERSIIDHAGSFQSCAKLNLRFYRQPSIRFLFYNGIATDLRDRLVQLGVEVRNVDSLGLNTAPDFPITAENAEPSSGTPTIFVERLLLSGNSRLNLDVSTMLAYISALTNGGCNFIFLEPILTEQASRERTNPIKPLLESLFQERELICCATAADDFNAIVEKVAGPEERQRGVELLRRVTVVPDDMSATLSGLNLGGKVRKRSQIIFGTGDATQSITVTANSGFVRAAQSQGITLAVYIHESRALSEDKERSARPLNSATVQAN